MINLLFNQESYESFFASKIEIFLRFSSDQMFYADRSGKIRFYSLDPPFWRILPATSIVNNSDKLLLW